MGCILACLRFKGIKKGNKAQLKASPVPSKTKEPLLSEDQFVSVFVSEGSTCVQVADLKFEDNRDIFDRELKDQVKILKSCGAIHETPAELQKASAKLIAQPLNKDIEFSNSSCIPDTPIRKLVWEEQQQDSEFIRNSAASSNFGEQQAQRHNDSASKTSSCVPGTQKLALDEEQEGSNFEERSYTGFICGVHHAQKHNDSALCTSASRKRPTYLESGSESVVLDASPSHHDTTDSACFGSGKHDPEIESSVDTQIQVHNSKDVCLESVAHDPGSESGIIASNVVDDSPSQCGAQIRSLDGKNSPYPTPLQLTDEMETPCTVYPSTRENLRRKNARVKTQYVYPVLNPLENLAQLKVQRTPVVSSSNNQNDKRSPHKYELDKENYSSVKKLRSLTPFSKNPQVGVLSLCQWPKHPPLDDEKKYTCVGQQVSWHAAPFEERLDKALPEDTLSPRRTDVSRNLVAFNDEGEESENVIRG